MATKNLILPWSDGSGQNLTVTYDDATVGTQYPTYSSPQNEGVDRELVVVVQTNEVDPLTSQQLVINEGMRQPLYSNEPKLVVPSDTDTFNILKSPDPISRFNEQEIQDKLNQSPSQFDSTTIQIYNDSTESSEITSLNNLLLGI